MTTQVTKLTTKTNLEFVLYNTICACVTQDLIRYKILMQPPTQENKFSTRPVQKFLKAIELHSKMLDGSLLGRNVFGHYA
jgi:hypothetical protein